jgi:hypothetical protein
VIEPALGGIESRRAELHGFDDPQQVETGIVARDESGNQDGIAGGQMIGTSCRSLEMLDDVEEPVHNMIDRYQI